MRLSTITVPLAAVLLLAGCNVSEAPADEPSPPIIETNEEQPTEVEDEEIEEEVVEPAIEYPEIQGVDKLVDLNEDPDIVEVELAAQVKMVELAQGLEVEMYAYNGSVPGPLLEAKVGDRVIVHFKNELTQPTTVHWHGLRISDDMDGNPRVQEPVLPGGEFTYDFVVPDEGTYWYHPHVRSHLQIERGLYAPMIVHALDEDRPVHDAERFFVLDDILLDGDEFPSPFSTHMEAMHGRLGNALLTNGTMDLFADSARTSEVERWRFVNTSNARTMAIELDGASFKVVGTDGGRIEPYETDRLQLAVGQRYDVEVELPEERGVVELRQMVLTRDSSGAVVEAPFEVFKLSVNEGGGERTEIAWPAAPAPPVRALDREETIVFDAVQGGRYGVEWRLNGQSHAMEPLFTFEQGETVKLVLRNELGPEHPFHLHGQFFTIPGEPGLRDTVLVPGQSTVEIEAYMDNPGQWMLHCHINEHAELGMMAEYIVRD